MSHSALFVFAVVLFVYWMGLCVDYDLIGSILQWLKKKPVTVEEEES